MPRVHNSYVNQYRVLGKNGGEYFRCNDWDLAMKKYHELRSRRNAIRFRIQTRKKRIGEYCLAADTWEPWQDVYPILTDTK